MRRGDYSGYIASSIAFKLQCYGVISIQINESIKLQKGHTQLHENILPLLLCKFEAMRFGHEDEPAIHNNNLHKSFEKMSFTFLDRIPQKPNLVIFHFEPSATSDERWPEKIPMQELKVQGFKTFTKSQKLQNKLVT